MNAAIRAVVRAGVFYGKRVLGVYRGYDGLIAGETAELNTKSVKNILDMGGTVLQQTIGETPRRGTGIEASHSFDAHTAVTECAFEFCATAGHVTGRLVDNRY